VSDYHKLSIADKRALNISTVRESAVACPRCETQLMPDDLLAHLDERCTGPREPGPGSKWVTWSEALALGVPVRTLTRWVSAKFVRFKGGRGDRLYLRRDLVKRLAFRRIGSRR
jgi:hypothetical protein